MTSLSFGVSSSVVILIIAAFSTLLVPVVSRRHRHSLVSDEVTIVSRRADTQPARDTCHEKEPCLYGVLKFSPRTAMKHVYKVIPTSCRCGQGKICYFAEMNNELRADIYNCYADTNESREQSTVREQQSILFQYLNSRRR